MTPATLGGAVSSARAPVASAPVIMPTALITIRRVGPNLLMTSPPGLNCAIELTSRIRNQSLTQFSAAHAPGAFGPTDRRRRSPSATTAQSRLGPERGFTLAFGVFPVEPLSWIPARQDGGWTPLIERSDEQGAAHLSNPSSGARQG